MNDRSGNFVDNREMLKVKVKSLAAEAKIIRKEERKARGSLRDQLHHHRVIHVRHAARLSCLAYGFIRGRRLDQMERTSTRKITKADWKQIITMCNRYGPYAFVVQDAPLELKMAA